MTQGTLGQVSLCQRSPMKTRRFSGVAGGPALKRGSNEPSRCLCQARAQGRPAFLPRGPQKTPQRGRSIVTSTLQPGQGHTPTGEQGTWLVSPRPQGPAAIACRGSPASGAPPQDECRAGSGAESGRFSSVVGISSQQDPSLPGVTIACQLVNKACH